MTQLKRYIAIVILAAATPALAGEVTGTGGSTPIGDGTAGSICAYSGLQDGDGHSPSSMVQNYGVIRAMFGGPAPFHGIPGTACNGS